MGDSHRRDCVECPYLTTTKRKITDAGLASCSSPLYPAGSILMTSRATIGAFAITQRPMAVNQGFIVVNPKDPDLKWWLIHEMRSRVDEFHAQANGATFLELPRVASSSFRFVTQSQRSLERSLPQLNPCTRLVPSCSSRTERWPRPGMNCCRR